MSPDVLYQIKDKLLEDDIISENKIDTLIKHLITYSPSNIVYPGTIKRKLSIPILDAYKILYALQELGVVKQVYEPYCHECDIFYDQTFPSLSAIPKQACCPQCRKDFNLATDAIVIFEVII